jgi:hypothetical protein
MNGIPLWWSVPLCSEISKLRISRASVAAQGFETLVTHVFIEGDEYLASDAVFGVKGELVAKVERHFEPVTPDGTTASQPWHLMTYEFQMKPGAGVVPQPIMATAATQF